MTIPPRSLFGRLALVQIGFGIVVALLFAFATGLTHNRFHLETSQRQGLAWAEKIRDEHKQELLIALQDRSRLEPLLATIERNNPSARFYVVSGGGEVLGAAVPVAELSHQTIEMRPIATFLSGRAHLPILIDDPLDVGAGRIFSAAILGEPESDAYFLMVLSAPEAQSYFSAHVNYLLTDSLLLAAGVTTPAMAASVVLLFMILRPVRRLSAVIETLESQQTSIHPAPAYRRGASTVLEFDELGHHFERMGRRISDLVQRQQEENRSRREMFANLSHDLRTPLSIIDGCLETLRNNRHLLVPSQEETLLAAAAGQCHSLKQLVESIFELATLEDADYPLRCETFPIGEMIDEVAARFPALVRQRNCAIVVDIAAADRQCRVCADPFLIERVLDNLIDNAVSHASGAKHIVVGMRRAGDTVEIGVSDDGCGLPAKVYETVFAAADGPSRWSMTGRGLRIVQRILRLHGSVLTVTSGEISGACFAFSLPLVGLQRHTT